MKKTNIYTINFLEKTLCCKYNNNWREFIRQKEGKWLYRNDSKNFDELKDKYKGIGRELRESIFQQEFVEKIEKILNLNNIKFELKQEVWITKEKRIDIILELSDYNLTLPIELKHDNSYWQKKCIQKQINSYNKILNNKTYLVSPKGRYGFSEKQFLFVIEHLIKKEEIYLPNSLFFIKKCCL